MPDQQLETFLGKIRSLPYGEQKDMLDLLERLETAKTREEASTRFLPFVKKMWPAFIEGNHHSIMGDAFERVVEVVTRRRKLSRLPIPQNWR